jgi:hypothetical protein
MSDLQSIVTSPFIGVAGVIVAIISLGSSFFFYRRSRREKLPTWSIATTTVIGAAGATFAADLSIHYKGQAVDKVSVSKFLFWNSGRETIRSGDVETKEHLAVRAKTEGTRILDAAIIATNCTACQFQVAITSDSTRAQLNLDYMDHDHGCVVRVVHTGVSSEDLDMAGSIVGVKGLAYVPRTSFLAPGQTAGQVAVALVVAGIITIFLSMAPWVPVLLIGGGVLWFVLEAVRVGRVPPGLDAFLGD